ncbi:MAG TPA: thioredoxin family protein [Planctomycetota bacterium]|nr:thioredoxin family protein [Planctomycetota bacterium]
MISKMQQVVSRAEWNLARRALLDREKKLTRLRDEVSRERRELPWVKVEKPYAFDAGDGTRTLADLFDGRGQLMVYHFMFGPRWEEGCKSCSFFSDHVDPMLLHLAHRDVSFAAVSRAPIERIESFKKRMGWKFPWVSSGRNDFNQDYHVSPTEQEKAKGKMVHNYGEIDVHLEDLPGLSVFARDAGGGICHTYSTYARGLDPLIGAYHFLDLVPKGRDEEGLVHSMSWVRHHDNYGPDYKVDAKSPYVQPRDVGDCCP